MLFNSIDFAIFLPVAFLLYWLLFNRGSVRLSNLYLIAISYLFYGWWNWRVVFLLFGTTALTYFVGLGIRHIRKCHPEDDSRPRFRKRAFWLHLAAIVINIGVLGFFKYADFFVRSFADAVRLFGSELSLRELGIMLPIGISFYIFQSLTYTIDVYLKKLEPVKDPITYFAFMSFFPPLLSGPIGRASAMLPQFAARRSFDYDKAVAGCKALLWGLFMKTCVADRLATYVDVVYGNLAFHNGTSIFVAAVF